MLSTCPAHFILIIAPSGCIVLSPCPFYNGGTGGTERLSHLPKVTQLEVVEAGFKPMPPSSSDCVISGLQVETGVLEGPVGTFALNRTPARSNSRSQGPARSSRGRGGGGASRAGGGGGAAGGGARGSARRRTVNQGVSPPPRAPETHTLPPPASLRPPAAKC